MLNIHDEVEINLGPLGFAKGIVITPPSKGNQYKTIIGFKNDVAYGISDSLKVFNNTSLSLNPSGISKIAELAGIDSTKKTFMVIQPGSPYFINKVLKKHDTFPLKFKDLVVGAEVRCLYPKSSNFGRKGKIAAVKNDRFEIDWADGQNTGRKWTKAENFELWTQPSKVPASKVSTETLYDDVIARKEVIDDLRKMSGLLSEMADAASVLPTEKISEKKAVPNINASSSKEASDEVYDEDEGDEVDKEFESLTGEFIHEVYIGDLNEGDAVNLLIAINESGSITDTQKAIFVCNTDSGALFKLSKEVDSERVDIPTVEEFLENVDTLKLKNRFKKSMKKLGLKSDDLVVEVFDSDNDIAILEYKGNKKMNTSKSVMDIFKGDLQNAGYRVASTQLTNAVKTGLLAMFKDKGMDEGKISMLKEFLESQFGNAFISALLGYGLTYAPTISEDPRVQKLAGEFRVQGMAIVGNEVIGTAMEYVMPALTQALKALPPVESTEKRIDTSSSQEAEDDDVDVDFEEESEKTAAA